MNENLIRCKNMVKQWPAWKRSVTLTKAMVDDKEECEVSTKLIKDLGLLIGTIRDRVDGVASTKVLQAIHRLMQLEENVERCSKRNEVDADRIAELEAQLKTAKRDAILEAAKQCGLSTFAGPGLISVQTIIDYANSVGGD